MKLARLWSGALALLVGLAWVGPATAGDPNGNFMVRVLGAVVHPDEDVGPVTDSGGAAIAGADADVSTEVIPAATPTYFFNKHLSVELICCVAQHSIEAKGLLADLGLGKLATTWSFPPAVTLQYQLNPDGRIQPYVGAGVQYNHFIDEGRGANNLNASRVEIDDAFGFVLQAGVDVSLGDGWFLNADVKKTWLNTEVTCTMSRRWTWAPRGLTSILIPGSSAPMGLPLQPRGYLWGPLGAVPEVNEVRSRLKAARFGKGKSMGRLLRRISWLLPVGQSHTDEAAFRFRAR